MRQACCFIALFALSAAPLAAEGIADQFKWNFQARVRGEMRQNVYDFDSSRSAVTDDAFDLRLASIEIGDPKHFSLKLGRQVLSYGDERLVGPLEWLNFSRTFDAVKLHYQALSWWIDAFTSSVVRLHESEFNRSDWLGNGEARQQFFSGLYFSSQFLPFQATDLYAFHLHEESFTGGTDFMTLGTRQKGDPAKLAG